MFIGRPIPPEKLVDREEIVKKLVDNLSNPDINTSYALLGYRRIGKSSILLKAKEELEKKGLIVVYYDVKERLSDPESFLVDLQTEILQAYGKHLGLMSKLAMKASETRKLAFRKISEIISAVDEIGLEISPEGSITPKLHLREKEKPDYAKLFRSVFKTANTISQKSERRVIIVLDEFQDITSLNEYKGFGGKILDLYRGVLQTRENVSHVISGSRVHMLQEILEDSSSPLFQHFIPLMVGPMKADDAARLFSTIVEQKRLNLSKDEVMKASSKAVSLVGGHPYYTIMLAEVWDGKISLEEAYDHLLSAPNGTLYIYTNYVLAEDLGKAKGGPLLKKVVRTIAQATVGRDKPTTIEASEIARKVSKTQNYLEFYLEQLTKFDIIRKVGRGTYEMADKVIANCIAKNYET